MSVQTKANDLSEERIRVLRDRASAASAHAYAPYSHFKVGASVLLENGHTVCACNVENASFRLTTCAEQAAIVCAVAEFGAHIRIIAVAIAAADSSVACQPCGACRQTIAEFTDGACRIFYPGDEGKPGECTLADLLPASFSAASLSTE